MEVDDDTPHITDYYSSNGDVAETSNVIETVDVTNYIVTNKRRHSSAYDKNLCKDNKLLTDFINRCLFLDPTNGMETVINKAMLPAYVCVDLEYKESEKFKKVLTKAYKRLLNDPDRKYTHISDVVETLKIHQRALTPKPTPAPVRKRVNVITLSTKVSVKTHEKCRKRPKLVSSSKEISPKKSKPEVIALDCDDEDVIPINDEANKMNISIPAEDITDVAKDNLVNDDTIEIQDSQEATKAHKKLLNDPDRKYTHISDVVETQKIHQRASTPKPTPAPVKKRVNVTTLSTKVSVKTHEQCRKRPKLVSSSKEISPKKSKPEVIALDCDDEDVIPINDEANKMNISNPAEDITDVAKDNLVNDDTIEIQDSQEVKIIDDAQTDNKETEHSIKNQIMKISGHDKTKIKPTVNEHEKENVGSNENSSDDNKLLVPQKEKIVRLEKQKSKNKEPAKKPEEMTDIERASRMKIIEAKIETCNKAIAKLDLEEVTDDSANSPYYKSDRLRATIVKLYKELCTLVGEEKSERRQIRLQIKEGVPQGPIKRLEKYLNKQADGQGETPFPDFSDVVRCVEKANEKDGLGWSKAKIMKEAQAIFTYCGRALQKRRQQREWNHLRAIADAEEFEADPADRDQELQARLEANRRLAQQREAEVFSKFTRMENQPEPIASTSFQIEEPSEHEDSSSDDEPEPIQDPTESTVLKENNNIDSINNDNIVDTDAVVIKQELEEVPIKIQYQGDISLVIEISDSESEFDYGVLTF